MSRTTAITLVLVILAVLVPSTTRAETIHSVHSIGGPLTDFLYAMDADSQGNVYLAGGYALDPDGNRYVSFLAKFSKNGTLLWQRTFTSGVSSALYELDVTPTGDIFTIGSSDVSTFVIRLSPAGDVIWAKDIPNLAVSYSAAVAVDLYTGGVVVMGNSLYDGCVVALDSVGDIRWSTHPDSTQRLPWAMVTDASGSSYVLIQSWDTNDIGIVKLSKQGNVVSKAILDTPGIADWATDIQFATDGGLICSGNAQLDNLMMVTKVASNLNGEWAEYIGSSEGYFECYGISTPANGSIYILAPGTSYADYSSLDLLFQFDPGGNPVEVSKWPGQEFWPQDIECLPTGGLAVAGTMKGVPPSDLTTFDNYTVTAVSASSWVNSDDTWSKTTETSSDADIILDDPDLPVDLFDKYLMEQSFYCIIEDESSLSVDIYSEFVAKGDTLVNLTAKVSGGTPPYNHTWSVGDGSYAYDSMLVVHRYPAPGIYYAQVCVEDSLKAVGWNATIVLVYGPPTVSQIGYSPIPYYLQIIEGIPLSMTVVAEDPDGGPLTFYWDFGDGNTTISATGEVTHPYETQGNYTVNLAVVDDEGDSNSTSVIIAVGINIPPWADVYYWPDYPHPGETIDFSAYTGDVDDWVERTVWDFGDNTTSSDYYAYHAYAQEGVYNVTLTVFDTGGKTGSDSVLVTVKENWPPVPDFWVTPWPPSANASTVFDAHQSDDPDGTIVAFDWDFGDGCTGVGWYTTHTYTSGGYRNATLTVTDDKGTSTNLTMSLYVNFDPVASFTFEPYEPLQNQVFVFNGNASYDTDGTIVSCIWSFGDGGTGYTYDLVIQYSYWKGGDYCVNLTVIDADGGANTTSRWIHVNWIPVADAGPDQVFPAGQEVTFNGSGSSGNGEIVNYTWEFMYDGQLTALRGTSPSFTFLIPGIYNITLTVTDEKGINATDQFTVSVFGDIPEFSTPLSAVSMLVTILALLVLPRRRNYGG